MARMVVKPSRTLWSVEELRYWVFSVHHKLGMMIYNRHAPESPGHYRTGGGAEL